MAKKNSANLILDFASGIFNIATWSLPFTFISLLQFLIKHHVDPRIRQFSTISVHYNAEAGK